MSFCSSLSIRLLMDICSSITIGQSNHRLTSQAAELGVRLSD